MLKQFMAKIKPMQSRVLGVVMKGDSGWRLGCWEKRSANL